MAMRTMHRVVVALAFAGCLAVAPHARAEEGPGDENDPNAVLREHIEKIIRLMRENEAALLEVAQRGGKAPAPVAVEPPTPPPAKEGGALAAGGEGTTPPEKTTELRRKLDELIRGSSERGRSIPKQLEELVKMWPT